MELVVANPQYSVKWARFGLLLNLNNRGDMPGSVLEQWLEYAINVIRCLTLEFQISKLKLRGEKRDCVLLEAEEIDERQTRALQASS